MVNTDKFCVWRKVFSVKSKKAVAIAAVTESLVSIVGIIMYISLIRNLGLNWSLIISLLIGASLSIPFAAYFVKKFHTKKLKFFIGLITIILGTALLTKLFL